MLSSGCNYCINQLTTNKYIYNIFTSGGSFHFNHPLFCPRILISNQAKEKLNLAYRELKRPDCPCQRENFKGLLLKSTHEEIAKKCNDGKCIFKQNGNIIEELAKEYQSKLEKNGINVPEK